MAFTTIPTPDAGTTWTRDDIVKYIVDNLNSLNDSIEAGSTLEGDASDIFVGNNEGTASKLAVADEALIIGGPSGVTTLAGPKSGMMVLMSRDGVVQWENVDYGELAKRLLPLVRL